MSKGSQCRIYAGSTLLCTSCLKPAPHAGMPVIEHEGPGDVEFAGKWIEQKMLKEHEYISPEDLDVFTVVDNPKEAAKIIIDFKESEGRVGIELPPGMKKF